MYFFRDSSKNRLEALNDSSDASTKPIKESRLKRSEIGKSRQKHSPTVTGATTTCAQSMLTPNMATSPSVVENPGVDSDKFSMVPCASRSGIQRYEDFEQAQIDSPQSGVRPPPDIHQEPIVSPPISPKSVDHEVGTGLTPSFRFSLTERLLSGLESNQRDLLERSHSLWGSSDTVHVQALVNESLEHLTETLSILGKAGEKLSACDKTNLKHHLGFLEYFLVFRCGCIDPDQTVSLSIADEEIEFSLKRLGTLADKIDQFDTVGEVNRSLQQRSNGSAFGLGFRGKRSQSDRSFTKVIRYQLPSDLLSKDIRDNPIDLWSKSVEKAEFATRKIFDHYPNPQGIDFPFFRNYFQAIYVELKDSEFEQHWRSNQGLTAVGIRYEIPYAQMKSYLLDRYEPGSHPFEAHLKGKQDEFKRYFKTWYSQMSGRFTQERVDNLIDKNPQCIYFLVLRFCIQNNPHFVRRPVGLPANGTGSGIDCRLESAISTTNNSALNQRIKLSSLHPGAHVAKFMSAYHDCLPSRLSNVIFDLFPTPFSDSSTVSTERMQVEPKKGANKSKGESTADIQRVQYFLRAVWDRVRLDTNAMAILIPMLQCSSQRDDSTKEAFTLHTNVKSYKQTAVRVGPKTDFDYEYLHANECSLDNSSHVVLSQVPTNTTKPAFWYTVAGMKPALILDLLTDKEKDRFRNNGSEYHEECNVPLCSKKLNAQGRLARSVNVKPVEPDGTLNPYSSNLSKLASELYDIDVTNDVTQEVMRSHRIERIHYSDWPDSGVISVLDLIDIVMAVRQQINHNDYPTKAIIHCKAGIGRSGVVMSTLRVAHYIDSLPHEAVLSELEVLALVLESIMMGRSERSPTFVQTYEQFCLILSTCFYLANNRALWQDQLWLEKTLPIAIR